MADLEAPAEAPPPAPKEKKKKKSVKSSESKSSHEALNNSGQVIANSVCEPQQNGITEADALVNTANSENANDSANADEINDPVELSKPLKSTSPPAKPCTNAERKASSKEETGATDDAIRKSMDEEKIRQLGEAFYLIDFNQDGFICKNDLHFTYTSLGQEDVTDGEIHNMLEEAAAPLDFESFVDLLGHKTIELDPEETLKSALSQWDYDGSGLISEARIRHDLMTWGDKFSEQEVDWALEDAPLYSEKDGTKIDYVEFCKKLCGLRKSK